MKWKPSKFWVFILTPFFITMFMAFDFDKKRIILQSVCEEPANMLFEDPFFRPVLEVFKTKSLSKEQKKSFRSGSVPTFLLVAPRTGEDGFWIEQLRQLTLNYCPLPCNYTKNRNESSEVDAVLFFMREVKNRKMMQDYAPNRDPLQPWIMISFEAPLRANSMYQTAYSEFNGVFNRTMTYRRDSDIILNYGFIVSKLDSELLPEEWRIAPPVANLNNIENRSTAVAFISNCNDNSGRLDYIKMLKKYTAVDVYGACGSLKCGSSRYVQHAYKPNRDTCFLQVGHNYMFFLAFENSICKDYFTEKLYNLLYFPMVPIVLGGAEYDKILPPNSYINAAHFSPKDLAAYLDSLRKNPKEYEKYFEWRKYYIPSTLGGDRVICDLCTKLYDPSFYESKVITNFSKWFDEEANCNRKWTPNGTLF